MCKCDAFDATTIAGGQPTVFTAFGKVEGADITKAKITSMTFRVIEDTTLIAVSPQIPAVEVSRTSSLVRYKSDWTYILPNPIKYGVLYYVRADIKCVQASLSFLQDRAVLAEQTQNAGIVDQVTTFFGSLFGGNQAEPTPQFQTEPTPTVAPEVRYNLQLKTFWPGQVINKACPAMTFRFDNPF